MSKTFVNHKHPLFYITDPLKGFKDGIFYCNECTKPGRFTEGSWICQYAKCDYQVHPRCLDKTVDDEQKKARELIRDRKTPPTPGHRFSGYGACGCTHQGLLTEEMLDFARNGQMRVLTNDSISCITLLCTNARSTLVNTRLPKRPITKLLYKFFLVREDDPRQVVYIQPRIRKREIEVQHITTYRNEIYRQVELYNKMFYLARDPNVANIVYSESKITGGAKQDVLATFSGTLPRQEERALLSDFFNASEADGTQYKVSLCVMEFMDGYMTLKDFLKPTKESGRAPPPPEVERRVRRYVNLELLLLTCCGFKHRDAHDKNVMINPNMPDYYGPGINFKIIILDFGRGEDIAAENMQQLIDNPQNVLARAMENFEPRGPRPELADMVRIFNTFKEALIVRHQLNAEEEHLDSYNRLKPYLDALGKKSKKRRSKKKSKTSGL